jgi:prepilin-type N-terminal cleavage/methylation domain-containing protein
MNNSPQKGFSLIEMAISLVIIALITSGILGAKNLIRASQVNAVITLVKDLKSAAYAFKDRYGYFPGDCPNTVADCNLNPGNGDGAIAGTIDAQNRALLNSETHRLPQMLFNSGFIGGIDINDDRRAIKTKYGPVHIVQVANAGAAPLPANYAAGNPMVRHVIIFTNLPCDVSQEVDLKIDDGNLNTGRIMALENACTGDQIVTRFAVSL